LGIVRWAFWVAVVVFLPSALILTALAFYALLKFAKKLLAGVTKAKSSANPR
jgi:hypothetical protein